MIEVCAIDGDLEHAVGVYDAMQFAKCAPDRCTYVALFQVVSSFAKKGR